ncbi:MAG: hypothetical protein QNL92_11550 [Octadecabacter sp.]
MFELFLPYVIGMALGIEPAAAPDPIALNNNDETEITQTVPKLDPVDEGSGDGLAGREPEPQVPTGKFTTAVEVRPILGMTKSNWVAVRLYEGQDLVYFTHLMSWRCGLWEVRYGVNGEPANTTVPMEPCNTEFAAPNAMIDVGNFLPYIVLPPESVQSIYVEITFDDGTSDFAQFNRNEVLIP